MGNFLVNILGIASGNRQASPGGGRPEARRDGSHSWSKSRGHKSHGRRHGDKKA